MVLYSALFAAGLPMVPALAAAVAAVTLVALVVEELGLRPSRTQSHLVLIFLTIGLSIILRGGMKIIWGKVRMAVPPLSGEEPVHLAGATIAGLVLFFRKTSLGLAMRAVAANEAAAAVVGLKVWRVKAMSFALAGALGGLAGCLVTPISTLSYDVGVLLGLKGFAAAILGGFGSFPGAIVGGLILGLLESLGAGYLSSAYKDVIAFVVLLLVLFVRPRGLLGSTG
jgi:branched-chain amino acid transport system permease protein